MLECDMVIVSKDIWNKVLDNDEGSIETLINELHNLTIYAHAIPVNEDEMVVSVRDLEMKSIIRSLTINTKNDND